MVVLIAPEHDVINEIEILHQLFEEGLQYYHLRKPNKDYSEHTKYLNQIDEKHHDKIVTHYYHELLNEFNLKGIHFQEAKRRSIFSKNSVQSKAFVLQQYAKKLDTNYSILTNKSISSSFHETEDIESCPIHFDYHLLSPVFSSISKKGYEGRGFDVNHINKTIVGMGGVTTKNLDEFTKLGFKGVGVLGGIWNSEHPVSDFKLMNII
ncbi:thiamine phosphate synthase [Hyunsoonleella ulvae]|uniref:thiamine phosphate synthase n=1 Tax=Hyunsoonleella ulvae TaxID=2799948 RepID=UPI0019396879|nr:thiamine phosphate synthase [Hyunsoonleella ulvae]